MSSVDKEDHHDDNDNDNDDNHDEDDYNMLEIKINNFNENKRNLNKSKQLTQYKTFIRLKIKSHRQNHMLKSSTKTNYRELAEREIKGIL